MQKNFSYPLIVEDIAAAEKKYHLTADKKDLEYLTEVLKVPAVKAFSSEIYTKMIKKEHKVMVWGTVNAELELQSVVSLEYFTKTYKPEFSLWYDTQATYNSLREEYDIEDDAPDLIVDGKIDLGQIAIEQVALVLEDYPRRDGEVFEYAAEFDPEEEVTENPFKVLEKLKK